MKACSRLTVLAAALLLAGCWQSNGSLYGGRKPLEPFKSGAVESINVGSKTREHLQLSEQPDGVYRLINDEKAGPDSGDNFSVRFFAVEGAPPGTLAYEAMMPCKADDKACTAQTAEHDYGLVRLTQDGAEIINPDCESVFAGAGFPGVKASDPCTFTDLATLEKALQALARTDWKPDTIYRFTGVPKSP